MERFTKDELDRFNTKWIEVDSCHLWQGALDKDGYGTFYFRKKARRCHRVAYYFHIGDIPADMVIDHICKNRSCVNPRHLRMVTHCENTMTNSNSVGYKNSIKTHCKHGHLLDKKYGKQRYCSICSNKKRTMLRKKWSNIANKTMC